MSALACCEKGGVLVVWKEEEKAKDEEFGEPSTIRSTNSMLLSQVV